jgi:hypothetical protein
MTKELKRTLKDLRSETEEGLVALSVMDRHDSDGNVLVILKSDKNLYHCHRYFTIGEHQEWTVSIDGSDVPLEAVFSWLNDPSGLSTRELVFPEPV